MVYGIWLMANGQLPYGSIFLDSWQFAISYQLFSVQSDP
jgi:hypothetical protein